MLGICGLGGCGKSSLAFEYAWRNLERYPGGVFVVNGESDEFVRKSLEGIHGEFIDSTPSNWQNGAKSFEMVITETLSWFASLRDKWLLLVDNFDEKELSACARNIFFGQWKNKTSIDILATSQALCQDLRLPSENCVELNPFSDNESVEFLRKRTGLSSSSDDQDQEGKELVQELGGLPLALEHTAAYIIALQCSIQLYL